MHPSAKPWVDGVRRPSPAQGARDLGWWLVRRPGAVLAIIGTVVRTCARQPGYLARSLATVPIAAAIARRVARIRRTAHPRPLRDVPGAGSLGVPPADRASLQHHRARPRHLRDAGDACREGPGCRLRRRHLLVQPRLPAPVRRRVGDARPRHPLRDRAGPVPRTGPGGAPKEGPISALCVASLQEHKGHRVLLEAVSAPGGDAGRIHLTLIGDGPERARLEEQARGLGIDGAGRLRGRSARGRGPKAPRRDGPLRAPKPGRPRRSDGGTAGRAHGVACLRHTNCRIAHLGHPRDHP